MPEGRDVGKPLKLREWQKKELRRIYGNVNRKTRRVILSFGRKNGKTTFAAILMLLHVVGPEAVQNSQICSAAQSRDQAALLFRLAAKIVRMSPTLRDFVGIRDTAKEIYCAELGTLYKALSADASTNFGLSPIMIVHDELGQVQGPRSDMYEALETACGAHENPLSVIISTQAPTDADLLSVLIDDALEGHDPETVVSLYTAPKKADPFSQNSIRLANPAYGDFLNEDEVKRQARDAKRMPSREAAYRNLILNQRVEVTNPFVSEVVWKENAGDPGGLEETYAGLDLAEVGDLAAFVMVSAHRKNVNVKPVFWLPEHEIEQRAADDRVPYDVYARDGHLELTPGAAISFEYVGRRIAELIEAHNIRKVAYDPYRMRQLVPWMIKAGLSQSFIDEHFVAFRQGSVSMGPALNVLEAMLLNKQIRHGMHPVLTMCASNAVVKADDKGNRQLDKKKSRGRIDGMVALAMAAAELNERMNNARVYPVELESILETIT